MQVQTKILIRLTPENREALVRAGFMADGPPPPESWAEFHFLAHSAELRAFLEQLEEAAIEFWIRDERQFSRKELRLAHALRVEPMDCITEGGSLEATEYDWSECCHRCMRVPVQTGHLKVDTEILAGKTLVRGRRGELIVNEQVALRMIKDSITGAILRDVRTKTGDTLADEQFYQVIPTRTLPQLISPPTRFLLSESACPSCGRGGLHLDSLLYYDVPCEVIEDLNVTQELFGEGAGLAPELVISQRFYNLLVSCGAHMQESEPVLFV